MKVMIFMLALVASFTALADQCAYNKITDAKSARALMENNDIILWCQSCGEKQPSHISKVVSLDTKNPSGNYYELQVKLAGQAQVEYIDLAYTYVRTASDIFTNVAHLVGCPSTGEATFIQTGPGLKKVAHFYNKKGERVDAKSATKESTLHEARRVATVTTPNETRMPASTK